VAPVGRPPVLRVGHQRGEVLLQRGQVELPEFLGIVEVLAQRVRLLTVLVQDAEVQLVRPPVLVRLHCGGGAGAVLRGEGTFGFCAHGWILLSRVNGVIDENQRKAIES
jgi:hypothetical protein